MNKISIITATYNSAATIRDCILSVERQTYGNIEHVIVDGASSDNTIDIINSQKNRVSKLISESDKGIYFAMNKGIDIATGEYIGILNSDDFYINESVISSIVDCFKNKKVDCIFGNINYVNAQKPDKIIRRWRSGQYVPGSFKKGWHPAHPAFFVRKSVYESFGSFNLELKLAADFELMLRFLEKHTITNYYLSESIVNMRLGGATSGSFRNILKQNLECYNAFRLNGIRVSPFYFVYRLLPKLRQFLNE